MGVVASQVMDQDRQRRHHEDGPANQKLGSSKDHAEVLNHRVFTELLAGPSGCAVTKSYKASPLGQPPTYPTIGKTPATVG